MIWVKRRNVGHHSENWTIKVGSVALLSGERFQFSRISLRSLKEPIFGTEAWMFRKRDRADKLTPLIPQWSNDRPWYRSLFTMIANVFGRLLGLFRRAK
jgi:hypothetical protein